MDTPLQTLPAITVPNDATGARVAASGRWVKLISCTTPTVRIGFDGSIPQRMYPGDCYPGPEAGFQSLWLLQDGGACTAVVQVANQPINGGDVITIPAMAADIALMQVNSAPLANHLRIPRTVIAQIGAVPAFTQIVTAAAATREVELVCGLANAGYVYLACANDVTDVLSFTELQAGASWNRKTRLAVFACSDNGTETLKGSVWW